MGRHLFFAVLISFAAACTAFGDDAVVVDRGLAFLAKDAQAWKAKHECASCHHAGLVVWALHEVKGRGHAVDDVTLADMTTLIANSGDGRTSVERPAGIPKAFNTKAVSFAVALTADPKPSDDVRAAMTRLLETVKSDQTEAGNWAAWPETRPPLFGPSDETATLMATMALLPNAANEKDEAAILLERSAAKEKSVAWLAKTPTDDDPQSVAMRVVLWRRLGRDAAEIKSLVARIKERQNADGGWSQTKEMASDAWATGQALYALGHAELAKDDAAIARGRAFLVSTQREDGSWAMTSRPQKPGGEGAKYLVPIVGAGSAWAVMGLVRTR